MEKVNYYVQLHQELITGRRKLEECDDIIGRLWKYFFIDNPDESFVRKIAHQMQSDTLQEYILVSTMVRAPYTIKNVLIFNLGGFTTRDGISFTIEVRYNLMNKDIDIVKGVLLQLREEGKLKVAIKGKPFIATENGINKIIIQHNTNDITDTLYIYEKVLNYKIY